MYTDINDDPSAKPLFELPTLIVDDNEDAENRDIIKSNTGYDENINSNALSGRKSNGKEINLDLGVSISSQVCYAHR